MSHEKLEGIVCPWCNHAQQNWSLQQDKTLECEKCGKDFLVTIHRQLLYSTRRKACPTGYHQLTAATERFTEVPQATADHYNEINFLDRRDWRPHQIWSRRCSICDQVEVAYTDCENETSPFAG